VGRVVALLLACLAAGCSGKAGHAPVSEAAMTITVTSTAFAEGGTIPAKYTCDGADVSPPLQFGGPPGGAAEIAVFVEDPDAPGGTFVHWVGWGIPPGTAGLAEGQHAPVEGKNGFRSQGYRGPCPPKGKPHRYIFTVYALSAPLSLKAGSSAAQLHRAIHGHVLSQGSLTGRYGR
jgi:Raf kinase inhibitor-like YbhB/YbcL family protein